MLSGMFGLLNVNKPPGPTSHDIVARVRRLVGRKVKVGHAGTLDPAADGVLVICLGPATKLADYVQALPKQYLADVRLGATSTTDDTEGEIVETPRAAPPPPQAVRDALARFAGQIQQVPPAHSAVHVAGRRAYKLARAGEKPVLAPRTVTIHEIRLLACEFPRLQIDVRCGSGTYIRSLARDIGEALGVGGYCAALTRTAVGPFTIDRAHTPDDLRPAEHLLDPLTALDALAKVPVTSDQADLIRNGRCVALDAPPDPGEVALLDEAGRLLALATVQSDARGLHPRRVFPTH